MDVVKMLEMWLEKDQIVARNLDEEGVSIRYDIEEACREIVRLRHFLPTLQEEDSFVCHDDDCSVCRADEELRGDEEISPADLGAFAEIQRGRR